MPEISLIVPIETIHFNDSYMNFKYQFNEFPTFLAIIPWLYMIPTFLVIYKIFLIYSKTNWEQLEPGKNKHVFLTLSLSLIFSYLFFFFDYLNIRFPATGLFTSFCANIEPNHWLKLIIFFSFYFNYSAMIFPCLLPIVRLIILTFPKDHDRINTIIMRVAIPFAIVYPIFSTFFLIPAIGTCKQLEYPYPFGAIWTYYSGAIFGFRNSTFYLVNTVIWVTLATIANIMLFFKITKARERLITVQTSGISHRAQVSITRTTIAMIAFYVTNGMFILNYFMFYGTSSTMAYSIVLRPFGNDLQICMIAWILFLTHPVFKKTIVNPEASIERIEPIRELSN